MSNGPTQSDFSIITKENCQRYLPCQCKSFIPSVRFLLYRIPSDNPISITIHFRSYTVLNSFRDILLTRFCSKKIKRPLLESTMGFYSVKTKIRVSYFRMRNQNIKFQYYSFYGLKVTVGTKIVTHGQMDARTF